ncbi:zinc finger, CCHC-type containing protein [Tanacetum coccineum]
MHFLISSMSVVHVLNTPIPEDGGDDATMEQIRKRAKWDNDDYVCRGLILNCMSDSLFDIYQNVESFKELWDSLEAKYMAEDASNKKFLEELTLVELGSHLRIEESLRMQDSDKPRGNNVVGPSVINMVEHNNSSRLNIVNDNIASAFKSTSKLNDSIIWHARLGHAETRGVTSWISSQHNGVNNRLHSKDEALDKFKVFKTEVELQQGSQIKRFRTDRGGEYMDTLYFQSVGIIHETTAPYTLQQNEAINDEMDSIMGNNTLVMADLHPGCKPLSCKWIFKRKLKVDGTIEKFKARLVIQGFRQKSGINYFDIYAPVARISTIRLLIAMISIHNLIIHQMDVKTSFLNSELEDEVYMNQP